MRRFFRFIALFAGRPAWASAPLEPIEFADGTGNIEFADASGDIFFTR